MAVLVFQHSNNGGPGRLGATLRDHGFKLDIRRPDLGGPANAVPSDLDNVHGIVILGGAMNVTEIDQLPWMQKEAELIRMAHSAQVPVIGICLGAQLIAHSLGGQVAPKDQPEIGFRPVSINTTGQVETLLSGLAWNHQQLFSCGQEVKQLPPGATLLASGPTCKVVCYKVGIRTFGFIFHFECDRPMTERLITESAGGLSRMGKSVSDAMAEADKQYPTFARLSDRLCVNIATYCFPVSRRLAV